MTTPDIDLNIDDAFLDKPYCFTLEIKERSERHFCLYPASIGKLHILKRQLDALALNTKLFAADQHAEALRVASLKREEVARVIAYSTLRKKDDILNSKLVADRTALFVKYASVEDLAVLLILILTRDNVEAYKAKLGITEEQERMRRVIEHKTKVQKTKNDFSFGGKTAYGTLIDTACERYGWTYDYVVWGISHVNLQLLLADRIHNIYLSDEELKKMPRSLISDRKDVIRGDDPRNKERIRSMNWR